MAADIHIGLVYAIAFAVSAVSILFRPAKNALVPLVVSEGELVTANSATTVTETLADLVGYPVAGLLVAALGQMIAAAFVIDSATYIVSALLLWSMLLARSDRVTTPFSLGAIWQEMVDGWLFLRRQTELFANTVVSTFAQVAVGAEVVCSVLYARSVLDQSHLPYPQNYSLLMASIGAGSIVGGIVIGAIADRIPKGPMSIAGFVAFGLCFGSIAFVRDPFVAIGVFFLAGATNMVFIIPNITLFQERTPQRLMGRVVSSRQAIVFGVMAAAMGAAGWLSAIPAVGPQVVLARRRGRVRGGGPGWAARAGHAQCALGCGPWSRPARGGECGTGGGHRWYPSPPYDSRFLRPPARSRVPWQPPAPQRSARCPVAAGGGRDLRAGDGARVRRRAVQAVRDALEQPIRERLPVGLCSGLRDPLVLRANCVALELTQRGLRAASEIG